MNKQTIKLLTIITIFLLGGLIRFYDITDGIPSNRPFRSAIIARGIYYENNENIPPKEAELAIRAKDDLGLIEPPLIEIYAVQIYKLLGSEEIWVGRVISITFWMLGGLALYFITKDYVSFVGSVAALGFYLFNTFGILFSRMFRPDSMMAASTVIAIWSLINWKKKRTFKWAVLTGLITGYAILSKSPAGFILLFPFAFFILAGEDFKQAVQNKQLWTILILAALPSVIYYYYGILIDGNLVSQFSGRFFINRWITLRLYSLWLTNLNLIVGLATVIFGIMGVLVIEKKDVRWLLSGWWLGYFVMGMVFPAHIAAHEYYHLPLLPILGASLASTIDKLVENAQVKRPAWALTIILLASFLAYTGFNLRAAQVELATNDYRTVKSRWERIGALFDDYPEAKIIAMTDDRGFSLGYYGLLDAAVWRNTEVSKKLRGSNGSDIDSDNLWAELDQYQFFLITVKEIFEQTPQLKEKLDSEYPLFTKGNGFIVYDLGGEITGE